MTKRRGWGGGWGRCGLRITCLKCSKEKKRKDGVKGQRQSYDLDSKPPDHGKKPIGGERAHKSCKRKKKREMYGGNQYARIKK